jgi:hypothetical protein
LRIFCQNQEQQFENFFLGPPIFFSPNCRFISGRKKTAAHNSIIILVEWLSTEKNIDFKTVTKKSIVFSAPFFQQKLRSGKTHS